MNINIPIALTIEHSNGNDMPNYTDRCRTVLQYILIFSISRKLQHQVHYSDLQLTCFQLSFLTRSSDFYYAYNSFDNQITAMTDKSDSCLSKRQKTELNYHVLQQRHSRDLWFEELKHQQCED